MASPPKIFISAAGGDLDGARRMVRQALLDLQCQPVEQPHFASDWRSAEHLLRDQIRGCHALIHLAGLRYGTEPDPRTLRPGIQRRSYAQMEHAIAREIQAGRGNHRFRIYTFVCPEDFPYDQTGPDGRPLPAELEEERELQELHRSALLAAHGWCERPRSPTEIAAHVCALREEFIGLRNSEKRTRRLPLAVRLLIFFALYALMLLVAVVLGFTHFAPAVHDTVKQVHAASASPDERAQLERIVATENEQSPLHDPSTPGERYRRALETVALEQGRPPAELRGALDAWATRLRANPNSSAYDLALADYKDHRFDSAASLASIAFSQNSHRGTLNPLAAIKAADLEGEADLRSVHTEAALAAFQKGAALARNREPLILAAQEEWVAFVLSDLGRSAEAAPLLKDVLEIHAQRWGENSPRLIETLNGLAWTLQHINRSAEAEPLLRRVLAIAEKAFGQNDPKVIKALQNLATFLQSTHRQAEAEPFLRRALEPGEKSLEKDLPERAAMLTDLARILQDSNRSAEAEPLLRSALDIYEKSPVHDQTNLATTLNNLGLLLQTTNRLTEAEPFLRRALTIYEATPEKDRSDLDRTLNNLARLLEDSNRLTEAESLLRRTLEIDEKSVGPDDLEIAADLDHLAWLLRHLDRSVEAEPLLRRRLDIYEKSSEKDRPQMASALTDLAHLLQDKKRFTEAEPLLRRALKIYEQSPEEDHSNAAVTLDNLGWLLEATDRSAEAEPLLRVAVQIYEKSPEKYRANLAVTLVNLSRAFQDTNRLAEAEPPLRRALQIYGQSSGNDPSNVAAALGNLAWLLLCTHRAAEAEPLCRRTLSICLQLTASGGRRPPYLLPGLQNYWSICTELQTPEKEINARLEQLRKDANLDPAQFAGLLRDARAPGQTADALPTQPRIANQPAQRTAPPTVRTPGPQLVVTKVLPEGQASQLGLVAGDIILRYGGQEVTSTEQIGKLIAENKDASTDLELLRDGKTLHLLADPGRLGVVTESRPPQ